MDKSQKRRFVTDLCNQLVSEMDAAVEVVPEDWDGTELRELLLDMVRERYASGEHLTGKRRREYRTAVLMKNLL